MGTEMEDGKEVKGADSAPPAVPGTPVVGGGLLKVMYSCVGWSLCRGSDLERHHGLLNSCDRAVCRTPPSLIRHLSVYPPSSGSHLLQILLHFTQRSCQRLRHADRSGVLAPCHTGSALRFHVLGMSQGSLSRSWNPGHNLMTSPRLTPIFIRWIHMELVTVPDPGM